RFVLLVGELRGVDANAAVSPGDAEQAAVVHAVEELRASLRVAAEPVLRRAMLKGGVDLAGVDRAAALDELKHSLRLRPTGPRPFDAGRPRMHQALRGPRQDAVVDKEVFFDGESRVAGFEVAGAVAVDAVAERKVLSSGRRAD